jgi:uncharacterized surface protein with fasciclin (FAS1) repeats
VILKQDDVCEVIRNDERFSILSEILDNTGIGDALTKERKAFTFFAPTDMALKQFPESALRLLRSPEGKELAIGILGRHIIPGEYLYSGDLRLCPSVKPLRGGNVKIKMENNALKFGRAPVRTPGIAARNGVIFPVDRILPMRRTRQRVT